MSNRLAIIENCRTWSLNDKPDAYEHYNAIVTRWMYRVVAAGMVAGVGKIVVGICQINNLI